MSGMEKVARALETHTGILRGMTGALEQIDAGRHGARVEPSGFASPSAFLATLRRHGAMPRWLEQNAATTYGREAIGPDGGYLVPPDHRGILEPIIGDGSLLGAFKPVVTTSNLVIVGVDPDVEWSTTGASAAITDEGATATASVPKVEQVTAQLHKVTALVHASEEIDDTSDAYGGWVWRALGRRIRNRVEALILWGSGVNAPLGIMRGPALITVAKESTQTRATSPLVAANVEKMVSRLLPGSFPGAIWVVHSTLLPAIMELGGGRLYNPDGKGPYGTLCGRPLYVSEHCSPAGESGDLVFVDPNGWLMAVQGPRNVASVEFAFVQFLKSFRSSLRIGGAPLLRTPVARRTGSDTMGHVVCLGV
jgi:HK97 family phage major capsid protein